MTSHQPAKFGRHRHCGRRDIMILGCHMISHDYVIEGSCNFMDRTHQDKLPSCHVWWP